MNYIALIHKEKDSDFGVSFPDFPGCVTAGRTLEEARNMAQEAIIGHIEVLKDLNEEIPHHPTDLDTVMSDPDNRDAVVFIVSVPSQKSMRVNVTFPEDILRIIDYKAHFSHMTRSAFLAHVALNFKDENNKRTR